MEGNKSNDHMYSPSPSSTPPPPSTPHLNQNPLLPNTDEMPQSFSSFFSGDWIDNVVLAEQPPIKGSLAAEMIREDNYVNQNSLEIDNSNYVDFDVSLEPKFACFSSSENNLFDPFNIHNNNNNNNNSFDYPFLFPNSEIMQLCSLSTNDNNNNLTAPTGYTCLLSDVVNFDSAKRKPDATMTSLPSPPPCNGAVAATSDGPPNSSKIKKNNHGWSLDEHKLFLAGMLVYGKGNWKNIANNVVITKTHTQVASHAQKHFLRRHLTSLGQKPKRSSIHDITTVDLALLLEVDARLRFMKEQ